MKELLIFPYSATAVEALDCLGAEWKCIGFISDDAGLIGTTVYGIPVYDRSVLNIRLNAYVLAIHGSPHSFRNRPGIISSLGIDPERFATVCHPSACISPRATLGKNVLIMAGIVITANASISDHVVILPNTVIHHDSHVGKYTLIASNVTVTGNVTVGENCYLGASSTIRNGLELPNFTLVGMNSNVLSAPKTSGVTIVGNPAKTL